MRLLAGLHDHKARMRIMIEELQLIRFTTCGVGSMLVEHGVKGIAYEAVSRHYEKIYQSSERSLTAAGFGPTLLQVIEGEE